MRHIFAATAAFAVCLLSSGTLYGQGARGAITGFVTDATGAVVPGATVTATNTATNVKTTTKTNDAGLYDIAYLNSGSYEVKVDLAGFRPVLRQQIEVEVGGRLTIDFKLEVATAQTTVEVTSASSPILESESASVGTVVDGRRISELPLVDGNPFMLANLAAGVLVNNEVMNSQRPFDNTGPTGIRTDGAPGGNTFTLDGAPNTGNRVAGSAQVAYVPPADAVQEFKVETVAFDAQHGFTPGANVNVSIKSGTNQVHGSAYEFYRPPELVAQEFFAKRRNSAPATFTYHRYGGTVGGPVFLPKVYNGRNKTFFFVSHEVILNDTPSSGVFTVPTVNERAGNFSGLGQIYDPFAATKEGTRIRRQEFPGNIIPASRLNAVGAKYLTFYPQPNQPGLSTGENNYLSNTSTSDNYNSQLGRVDHAFSDHHRFFVRFYRNLREQKGDGFAGKVNDIFPAGNRLLRGNQGTGAEHLWTISPSSIFSLKVGFTRWYQGNDQVAPGFDLGSLGFPPSLLAQFRRQSYFPQFTISGFQSLSATQGDFTAANNFFAAPTYSKITGRHVLRIGYDYRAYLYNGIPKQASSGVYDFNTNYTRGPLDNSSSTFGQGLASVLVGLPTGGKIDRNGDYALKTAYHGMFVQDNFKINAKLTVTLGLRYEMELPTTERFNRSVRSFDPTTPTAIDAAVRAAYAATPDPAGLPVSALHVNGGLTFASAGDRFLWHPDRNNFQPRAGVAWQVTPKTVLRGGWGMYMVPWIGSGLQQPGFSQSTDVLTTLDGGYSFIGGITNPFPLGIAEPAGNSAGLATFVGQAVAFTPLNRVNGLVHRWEMGVQRELPGRWKLEISYSGSKGFDLPYSTNLNAIPAQYLSKSNIRDQPVSDYLNALVANPFRNQAPILTALGSGTTIQRNQLLRPFPQFTTVTAERYDGSTIYHGAQFRLDRRFHQGFTLGVAYTRSKLLERISLLNETDVRPEERIGADDRTERFVTNGIFELPFGRRRHWGSNWGRAVDSFFGGWQLGGIFMTQTGRPLAIGNVYFNGNTDSLGATYDRHNLTTSVFDVTGFYFTDAAVMTNGVLDANKQRRDSRINVGSTNIRTFPSMLSSLRGPAICNLDFSMIKNVPIGDKVKIQLRGEALNALNYIQWGEPSLDPTSASFGVITRTRNPTRQLQFAARITF